MESVYYALPSCQEELQTVKETMVWWASLLSDVEMLHEVSSTSTDKFLSYQMAVYLDMFGTLMENRISCNMEGSLVIVEK